MRVSSRRLQQWLFCLEGMAGQPGIRPVYTAGAFKLEEVAGERGIPSLDRFQEESSSTRLSMILRSGAAGVLQPRVPRSAI